MGKRSLLGIDTDLLDEDTKEMLRKEDDKFLVVIALFVFIFIGAITEAYKDNKKQKAFNEKLSFAEALQSKIGIEWVSISGGKYITNVMNKYTLDLSRQHYHVNIDPFELSKTEVTVGQYRACVADKACSPPFSSKYSPHHECNWTDEVGEKESFPINCVTWGEARTFAQWIGPDVDLPTQHEWEQAVILADHYNALSSESSCDYSLKSSIPVKSSSPNSLGIYGLIDNVSEWMLDEVMMSKQIYPFNGNEAAKGESGIYKGQYITRGGRKACISRESIFLVYPRPAHEDHQNTGFRLRRKRT